MKDYIILEEESLALLGGEVSRYLRCGWQLHGSPFSRDDTGDVCQALVHERIVHRTIQWVFDKPHCKAESKCGFYRIEQSEGELTLYCENNIVGTFKSLIDCLDDAELIEAEK